MTGTTELDTPNTAERAAHSVQARRCGPQVCHRARRAPRRSKIAERRKGRTDNRLLRQPGDGRRAASSSSTTSGEDQAVIDGAERNSGLPVRCLAAWREAGDGHDHRETKSSPGSPGDEPEGDPSSAAGRSGAGFRWRFELGQVDGLVGAAGAVPGSDVDSEVVEDSQCDGLSHPRRCCGGGAAAEKRHRPVLPLPAQRQQHPALGPAARRDRPHDGGRGEAAAAGHQDVQQVGLRQGAIGSRSACGGPYLGARPVGQVRQRLTGWCSRCGDRGYGDCGT